MLTMITMMTSGLAVGFAMRRRAMGWVARVVAVLVWLLLLLLGMEVGGNSAIIAGLHRLGVEALVVAACATAGSVLGSVLLWRSVKRNNNRRP